MDASERPIAGFLVVDKPESMSSMSVVAHVRRCAGRAKTGHAGTLDPLATGVLVLAVGRATKQLAAIVDLDKRYETTIDLSAFTTTDDREGEREEVSIDTPPTRTTIEAALPKFTGMIMQRPPAFSAMKVRGRRAYALARAGENVELAARPVMVHAIAILAYDWPMLTIDVHCGKGTYIRSLARDLGTALGLGGHCATLRRTAIGPFDLTKAVRLDNLPARIMQKDLLSIEDGIAMANAWRVTRG